MVRKFNRIFPLFSWRNKAFQADYERIKWLVTLSDAAKLREKILVVARNERNGLLIIPMGVFLAGAGLIFSAMGNSGLAFFGGIAVSVLGVFSSFFGFYVTVHYAHQYNKLLRELEHTP
jgi:hypothetical protein